jgi:hypothetical protein
VNLTKGQREELIEVGASSVTFLGDHTLFELLHPLTRQLIEGSKQEHYCQCGQEETAGFWLCRYHRGFEDGIRAAENWSEGESDAGI